MNRGLLIASPHAADVKDLHRALHLPENNVSTVASTGRRGVDLNLFQLVTRIRDVQALHAMVDAVETRHADNTDRRLFICQPEHVWPPRLREIPGVDAKTGAKVLAMAYETPGRLRVHRARGTTIDVRLDGLRQRFGSFEQFCEGLTFQGEWNVHQAFYQRAVADWDKMLRQLSDRSQGDDTGHRQERIGALRALVGAQIWEKAAKELTHEVEVAASYWISPEKRRPS